MNLACREHVLARGIDEWRQQITGVADPVGQCRTIEFDAFASEDLRLSIEWQMVAVMWSAT
jgi:hypothetical protein